MNLLQSRCFEEIYVFNLFVVQVHFTATAINDLASCEYFDEHTLLCYTALE
jgi:hypothetical protein